MICGEKVTAGGNAALLAAAVLALNDAALAHARMESSQHIGKIVLKV